MTYEQQARARKAYDLARAFRVELTRATPNLDTSTKAGAAAVLGMARTASEAVWATIAELHGINRPSEATIMQAVGILEAWERVAGTDPFANLT